MDLSVDNLTPTEKMILLSTQHLGGISQCAVNSSRSNQRVVQLSQCWDTFPISPRGSLQNAMGRGTPDGVLAGFLVSAIGDAVDQLEILGASMVPRTKIEIASLEDRAREFVADDPIFDSETGEPFEESFNRKKVMKLYSDSSKIIDLLNEIKIEMRYEREHNLLTDFLQQLNYSKIEEDELFFDEKRNFAVMNSLKHTLLSEQRDSKKRIHSLNEEVAALADHAEDVIFENLLQIRYIDCWEKARNEQNLLTCFQRENELETTINKYRNEIEKETRVHTEIESYIFENQKDMEEAINQWVDRYEKDSEYRIVRTQVYKEKREELAVEYADLIELYETHQLQIDEYLAYKDRKRIEEERLVVHNAAAVKIQAWWRGLMVRLKLGPFNPNKGKKGKGKGKGKDKDKKKGKKK